MNSVSDVSDKLGEYMLKGWVLTDHPCPTKGCNVPLLRSPSGSNELVEICVRCDKANGIRPPMSVSTSSSSPMSDSHASRSSTPPTELSSTLSSPVFAPPADTEESRRRREQSDQASSEIGKRLLKGWAMLGEECPNSRCYGIPLVRPPKAGSEKDPRKECVICGRVYLTEIDWAGRERLVLTSSDTNQTSAENDIAPLPPPKLDETPQASRENLLIQNQTMRANDTQALSQPIRSHVPVQICSSPPPQPSPSSPMPALEDTSQALQATLRGLSARLETLSGLQTVLDPSAIGTTADAISKVTQALSQIRQLQWNEGQVRL